MIESNRIEHKQTLTDSFEKEAVAFLNSNEGGKNGMSEKGCYIRIGSSSEPMTASMIETLFF